MSFRRHVNGLEFCYRILVDASGLRDREHLRVLNYDGSLRAFGDQEDGSCGVWPGDGTAHRMHVNAQRQPCSVSDMRCVPVGEKLTPDDQLFINTTGHGGHHGDGRGPDLLTYPHCERYRRGDFCADLATLPPHRSLVVLMAQCFSGGFNQAVIDASRAESTFIASATSETRQSFMSWTTELGFLSAQLDCRARRTRRGRLDHHGRRRRANYRGRCVPVRDHLPVSEVSTTRPNSRRDRPERVH